jgi:hypothetical protein
MFNVQKRMCLSDGRYTSNRFHVATSSPTTPPTRSLQSKAAWYGLDGPGIESRWGDILRTLPDRNLGSPTLQCNGYLVSFPGVKRPGCGVDNASLSSVEVKERVELCLYSRCGPSRPVLGRNLPFLKTFAKRSCVQHAISTPPLSRFTRKHIKY